MVAIILEIGLRILGILHLKNDALEKSPENAGKNCTTIVCLGDSFTVGEGSSYGNDYPSQLERLLNARAGENCFRVVNRGMSGKNTSQVLDKLDFIMELDSQKFS